MTFPVPLLHALCLATAALLGACSRAEPERVPLSALPPPALISPPDSAPPAVPSRPARQTRGSAAAQPPAAPAVEREPEPPTAPTAGRPYVSPAPTAVQRDQAALIASCREQAERIIVQRDRGQLLREDEQAARLGASASVQDTQFTSDRLGRVFARDRMAEECVEANRPLPPRR
jgi:hypothetical protein